MARKVLPFLFVVAPLLVGCDLLPNSSQGEHDAIAASAPEASAFRIKSTPDGRAFLLNESTGELHLITSDRLVALRAGSVKLAVGEYYEMPDATGEKKFLKYLGNGQFEQSAFAVRRVSE